MARLKNLMMACLGFVAMAMSLASCINNDDNTLDSATQKQYQTTMSGQYQGKVRFYYPKTSNYTGETVYQKYDSISTSWYVNNDSTFVFDAFPIHMLDSAVVVDKSYTGDEAEKYRSLSKAISDLGESDPMVTLKCQYYIPSSGYVSNTAYNFIAGGYTITKNISFNGASHTVYFVFGQGPGAYVVSNRAFQGQIALYAICIDNLNFSSQYTVPSQFFKQVVFTYSKQ